jgi:hypothetical protein
MLRHRCGDRAATPRTKLKKVLHVPIQRQQDERETKSSGDEAERETKWAEGRDPADDVERARSGRRDRAAEATG